MGNSWVMTIDDPQVGEVTGVFNDTEITYTPRTVELTYAFDTDYNVWALRWARVDVYIDTPGKSRRDVGGGTFDLTDVFRVPNWLHQLANRYRPVK
jgi:hypothetical protein